MVGLLRLKEGAAFVELKSDGDGIFQLGGHVAVGDREAHLRCAPRLAGIHNVLTLGRNAECRRQHFAPQSAWRAQEAFFPRGRAHTSIVKLLRRAVAGSLRRTAGQPPHS